MAARTGAADGKTELNHAAGPASRAAIDARHHAVMAEEAGACDRRAVVGARRGQVEHERVDVGARLRTRVEGVVSRLRAATRKAGHCDGNVRAGVRHGKVRRAIAEVHRARAISPLPAQAGRLCLQRLPPSLTLGGSPCKTRSDANLDWPVLTAEK